MQIIFNCLLRLERGQFSNVTKKGLGLVIPCATMKTGKIPTAFYEQYLEEDSNSFSSTNEFIPRAEKFFNFSQAALIRFGALTLSHPFLSLRLLRQVQCGHAVDIVDGAGFYKKPSPVQEEELLSEAK